MIRLARADEAAAVNDIVQAAYCRYVALIGTKPGPMSDDYVRRITQGQVWVVENGEELVGVLVLQEAQGVILLDNIAVHPMQQRQGHGRVLLDFAEVEAIRRGYSSIMLYTNVRMVENIAIYAARGYVELDRRNDSGFDRVYMAKQLR